MTLALGAAALPAAPDLVERVVGWLAHLRNERRLAAAHTLEAYGRDVRQFLAFLTERFEAPPAVADFVGCLEHSLKFTLVAVASRQSNICDEDCIFSQRL
jgi:hypothetical protein